MVKVTGSPGITDSNYIDYDTTNTKTIQSTNVQDAIEELDENSLIIVTQDQYDGLSTTEQEAYNYLITDASNEPLAQNVTYSNTKTGYDATNVQDAIDETAIIEISLSDFNKLTPTEQASANYFITDGVVDAYAENVPYDNTDSGMTSTNVQDAIDELNSDLTTTDWVTLSSGFTHRFYNGFHELVIGVAASVTSSPTTLYTLASAYRPSYNLRIAGTGSNGQGAVGVVIDTSGVITATATYPTTNSAVNLHVVYS